MNHIIEPGKAGSYTDIIVTPPRITDRTRARIRFISSYQCESDYEFHGLEGWLTFRWGKVPWGWSWSNGRRYWNYTSEEEFNRIGPNASWGILHNRINPIPAEVLEIFRDEYCGSAVAGFYDLQRQEWVIQP